MLQKKIDYLNLGDWHSYIKRTKNQVWFEVESGNKATTRRQIFSSISQIYQPLSSDEPFLLKRETIKFASELYKDN